MKERFVITLSIHNGKRYINYKFNCHMYYQSVQVLRFELTTPKGQFLKLEKRLLIKRSPWKIIGQSFEFKSPRSAEYVAELIKAIEYESRPERPEYTHPKNA